MLTSWEKISNQEPPSTLVVVHSSQNEFHDRYIVTDGAGLSLGTSLNGLGNRESFITVLNPDDVKHVEITYISPKLRIEQDFAQIVYFELEDSKSFFR